MPGLVVFNRRWSIGSDDLAVPAAILAFLNSIWVLAVVGMLIKIHVDEQWMGPCSQGFLWYPVFTVALLILLIINHSLIAVHSGRGGVFNTKARSHLPSFCYIRSALLAVEIVWACAGCAMLGWKVKTNQCSTSDMIYLMICVVVGSNVVVIFLTLLTTYISFDSVGEIFTRFQRLHGATNSCALVDGETVSRKLKSKYEEKWLNRVSRGFCCAALSRPSDKDVFKEIALLLANYLDHLDVVLTDFIAGMILLRKQQKHLYATSVQQPNNDIYQYLSGMAISPRTKFLILKDDNTQSEFGCMVHFAEYAVASYGYQGQYFFFPGQACCRINVCGRCRGCPARRDDRILVGDNCCQCQYTAITECSPLLSEDDFVYGNYHNECNVPSYYVCLDHKYKKVVLCIRGTMSITDVLIDLQGDCEGLNADYPTWKGHRGISSAADYIYLELIEKQILESAFSRCQTSGYKLLITGHSLGAGVAAIISFRLRSTFPDLYCYAFSPPGGLLSPSAMEESKKFTTSIVIGKDIIPRLGLSQMEYFRSEVLSMLENSSTPKWRILMSSLPLLKYCFKYKETSSLPTSRSQDYNPFYSRALSSLHEQMFLPGKVLHIVKSYPKESHNQKPLYQAVWADNSSFDSIIVSPSMIDDHVPDNVLKAMQQVLKNHGPKKPEKMLSEEERQAMLQIEDGEDEADLHSTGTDLSWEYTCQMEASVALQSPATEDYKPKSLQLLTSDTMDKPPNQWLAAPLASEEDLLSLPHSARSMSSNKSLSESKDESHSSLPPSKSTSEHLNSHSQLKTSSPTAKDKEKLRNNSNPSSEVSSPGLDISQHDVDEQILVDETTEYAYFTHIGQSNQASCM